jgi:tryptophan-rich sensory protein
MEQHFVSYSAISCVLIMLVATVFSIYGYLSRKKFEQNHPNYELFAYGVWQVWVCIFCLPLIAAMFIFSASKGAVKGYDELLAMNLLFLALCLGMPAASNVCLYVGQSQLFAMNMFGRLKQVDFKDFELVDEKESWIFGGYTLLVGKRDSIRIWREYENSKLAIEKIKNNISR